MTVIRPNSISGINSITAQSGALNFYDSAGATLSIGASVTGNITGNVTGNATGLSGTPNLNVGIVTATSFVIGAGTTSAPSLSPTGDSNTGIFFPSSDTIAFAEGGAEVARFDSSSRLLLGTSTSVQTSNGFTPALQMLAQGIGNAISLGRYGNDQYSSVFAFLKNRNTSIGSHTIVSSGDMIGRIQWDASDGTVYRQAAEISAYVDGTPGNDDMPGRLVFSTSPDGATSPVERMRIANNGLTTFTGVVKCNVTSIGNGFAFSSESASTVWDFGNYIGQTPFYVRNGATGVQLNAGSTSWSTSSDERFKTDLIPIADGLSKVGGIRSVTGRYVTDPEGTSRSFLIAQDVQQVLPEAVEAGEDEDQTLSLRYTETIPLLVAALKEAKERIETLEAKVAALEAS